MISYYRKLNNLYWKKNILTIIVCMFCFNLILCFGLCSNILRYTCFLLRSKVSLRSFWQEGNYSGEKFHFTCYMYTTCGVCVDTKVVSLHFTSCCRSETVRVTTLLNRKFKPQMMSVFFTCIDQRYISGRLFHAYFVSFFISCYVTSKYLT